MKKKMFVQSREAVETSLSNSMDKTSKINIMLLLKLNSWMMKKLYLLKVQKLLKQLHQHHLTKLMVKKLCPENDSIKTISNKLKKKALDSTICIITFKQSGFLKKHNMQINSNQKLYSCATCEKVLNEIEI